MPRSSPFFPSDITGSRLPLLSETPGSLHTAACCHSWLLAQLWYPALLRLIAPHWSHFQAPKSYSIWTIVDFPPVVPLHPIPHAYDRHNWQITHMGVAASSSQAGTSLQQEKQVHTAPQRFSRTFLYIYTHASLRWTSVAPSFLKSGLV